MLTGGQTNMKLFVFRNFAKASKNYITRMLTQCTTVKLIINNDYFPKPPSPVNRLIFIVDTYCVCCSIGSGVVSTDRVDLRLSGDLGSSSRQAVFDFQWTKGH
jgi:hypothetical protein